MFPSAEFPASRHGSGVRAFILREGLVSLCQVNLFNIAAKYNKSHVPNAPEGAAVITTSWPISISAVRNSSSSCVKHLATVKHGSGRNDPPQDVLFVVQRV